MNPPGKPDGKEERLSFLKHCHGPMKILIAEDDPNTRNGLREIFQEEGYEVVVASNGTEALSSFESRSPQVVCLDIMMPGLNGYEVCRRIRARDQDVAILFI